MATKRKLVPWSIDPREMEARVCELVDQAERLTSLLAHIVEYSHYATDDDTPAEVLHRIEAHAREVARDVGYDGTTIAAFRKAGRAP